MTEKLPRFKVRPLSAEEGNGYLLEFPDYPGCMADGDTPEQAIAEGYDALKSYLATLKESGTRQQAQGHATINIAEDYTRHPNGRYIEDGKGNGTGFRKEFLRPAMENKNVSAVNVVLDGAKGYPSSFLEEAFGGLVREEGFSARDVLRKFVFVANKPGYARYIDLIKEYIQQAEPKTH